MSFNRLMYDSCAYKKCLQENSGTLSYVLNPIKYENCSKCRIEFGVVGGTNVSHNKGNLVDIENDLKNITRKSSKCPSNQYTPKCDKKNADDNGLPCGPYQLSDKHLKPCGLVKYREKPNTVGYELNYHPCGK